MRGWTDKVLKVLQLKDSSMGNYHSGQISGQVLLEAAKLLPVRELSERQNEAPTLQCFLALAKKFPDTEFIVYVIDKSRSDERLTVEGAVGTQEAINDLLLNGNKTGRADEQCVLADGRMRVWWD